MGDKSAYFRVAVLAVSLGTLFLLGGHILLEESEASLLPPQSWEAFESRQESTQSTAWVREFSEEEISSGQTWEASHIHPPPDTSAPTASIEMPLSSEAISQENTSLQRISAQENKSSESSRSSLPVWHWILPRSDSPTSAPPKESQVPESSSGSSSSVSEPSSLPESSKPISSLPENSEPASSLPESSEPASSLPESSEPASSLPENSEPASSLPESSEPVSSLPESSKPVFSLPESSEPASSLPESSEPVSSFPESSKPASSLPESSEPDKQDLENDRLAGELERQYGVTIRILRNAEADPTGLAQDYAGPDCAARCLEAIDQALSAFPSAFFQNDVVFLLATRFSPEAVVSSPGALVLRVSCTALDVPGMQASLAAYSADRFLYEGSCQPEGYAPRGFVYGYPQERYLFSEDTPYTGYFLSMTAQQSPEQDVREILLALFCDPGLLEFAEPDTPFYEKMVYCCEQFLEWRPELAENQAVQYFLLL